MIDVGSRPSASCPPQGRDVSDAQAWFDLGSSQQIDGTNFGALDDANILAFDGLFVRGEYMF